MLVFGFLQNTIYTDLLNNINLETAQDYLQSQKMAIDLAKNIIEKENINCFLEKVDSYVFTTKPKEIKKLKQERYFLLSKNLRQFSSKF